MMENRCSREFQNWKWWELSEMLNESPDTFKPEWLPRLLQSVLGDKTR